MPFDVAHLSEFLTAGLTAGAIYALIAYGYNVVFATSGVLNFAHGQIFMVGMMLGAVLYGAAGLPILLVVAVVVLAGAVLGLAEEWVAIRPLRRRASGAMGWVLSTLGVSIVLQSAFSLAFGPQLRAIPPLTGVDPFRVRGVLVDPGSLLVIGVALVVGVALHLFYERTLLGRTLGAVNQDADAAAVRGIPVSAMTALAFVIGSALASLTGLLAGSLSAASPSVGLEYGLKGFVVAAAGGVPSIKGAVIAGLAIGLLEQAAAVYIGSGYRNAVVFVALLVVLMRRPAGLFGAQSVRLV